MLELKVIEDLHFFWPELIFFLFFLSCKPIQDTVFIFFIIIINEKMGSGAVMTYGY